MAGGDGRIDTATVLFTDLVGSTALRTRIGEEAADELRVAHDALIADAVGASRGLVVKHTGDGVMATFSAAVDAVSAAVAIQQAVDGHNRRSVQERIEVRVGISVGDVTFEGDDCFGLPVIEAQRLEAAAEGGQILCAEIVRHLARGRGGHEFERVGDLDLKGIPDPVPAAVVRWEPVERVAMPRETPLPAVLAAPAGFDLSGRGEELGALVDAWKASSEGHRAVVLISGEPGVGKTRLATEVALVARHQGGLVLGGRCDEELALPYQPFAEALRFQSELDDVPTAWLGPLAGQLTRLVPDLGARVPGLAPPVPGDPESERARLFEAVTAWIRTTAASVPVLLVLDDLHWADKPTLQLLRHLVHETPNDDLFVIGTYRSTDLDRAHPLAAMLADLRRDGTVTRLALDGLTTDGVAELLERAAGHDLDDAGLALAIAVHTETSGNPFFVGEIVRHLVESGALVLRDGRWVGEGTLGDVGLPEGVREVVGRRISRLDDDAQRLLSVGAVVGHEFGLAVLAAVAGVDEDDAVDRLDAARAASLVNEVGLDRYRFAHALVRATLLEELSTTRRVRTHRRIAEAIEEQHAADLDPVVSELAYHYGEAAAAGPAKAVEFALRAADQAFAAVALDDAVHWYALALEHLEADDDDGDVATRAEVLTRLGETEYLVGIDTFRSRLRDAGRLARDAGLDDAMVGVLSVRTRTSFDEGQEQDLERIALYEIALDRVDDPHRRARLLTGLAVELIFTGETERRTDLLREARGLAAELDDPVTSMDVLQGYAVARPYPGWSTAEFLDDWALMRDTVETARRLGGHHLVTIARVSAAIFALRANDGAFFRAQVDGLADVAEGTRNGTARRMQLLLDQMLATIEGRLVEAQALSVEVFQAWSEAGAPEATTYQGVTGVATRREQCRLHQIVEGWTLFLQLHPRAATVAATIAFALLESGDIDAAAARLRDAARVGFDAISPDTGWELAVAMWGEVAAGVADREAADALHGLVEPYDGRNLATGGIFLGPAARILARLEVVLDRADDADLHFSEAIDQSRRLDSAVWIARSCLDRADALVARGARDLAREMLADAEAAMGSLHLPRLEQQAAAARAHLTA